MMILARETNGELQRRKAQDQISASIGLNEKAFARQPE